MRVRTSSHLLVALSALTLTIAIGETEQKPVSFKVRVCEILGDSAKPLLNDDAEAAWDDCEAPVAEVPVKLSSGGDASGLVETSAAGVASVGPVSVAKGGMVRLMVACTTHHCLNFSFDERGLREGENLLVWRTLKLPTPDESGPDTEVD